MAANYNNSAWFYDKLAYLVYGDSITNAQQHLLKEIQPGTEILIAGGGTGWILEALTQTHPSGLRITYVEIAPNMMARSKKRNIGQNRVLFINEAIENAALPANFDIVITPFLLDNFTEQNLPKIFAAIDQLLKKDGKWLNASFQLTGKWWQSVLLKSMFLFFRLTCRIEASILPGIAACFSQNGYKIAQQKTFFGDFIGARIYQKVL